METYTGLPVEYIRAHLTKSIIAILKFSSVAYVSLKEAIFKQKCPCVTFA